MGCWSRSLGLGALLALGALAPVAGAHDFWLQPSSWRPTLELPLALELRVGDNFQGDPVARDEAFLASFVARQGQAQEPVRGLDKRSPAGFLRPASEGLIAVGYESRPRSLELAADKFHAYLAEEGLEVVQRRRKELGEAEQPARERYVRCAKALLPTGGEASAGFDQPLGLTLELVPESDPFQPGPLRVRLLREGKPVAGVLVNAVARDVPGRAPRRPHEAPPTPLALRTDAEGRAVFPQADGPGTWLVTAVHMERLPQTEADQWESHWASLTYRRTVPAPAKAAKAPRTKR